MTFGDTRITLTPAGDRLTVRYTFVTGNDQDPRLVERVMFWADGRELPPPAGSRVTNPDGTWTDTFDRPPCPPDTREVVASVWDKRLVCLGYLTRVTTAGPHLRPGTVVRTLFHCPPEHLEPDPALRSELRRAGVNALTTGVFDSPGNNPVGSFAEWRQKVDERQFRWLNLCREWGFLAVGIGDDLVRGGPEQNWILTSPWAEQAVRYAAARCRDAGILCGVEMVDEVGGDPAGPEAEAHRRVVGWWRDEGGPPLSWPNQHPAAWEVPAYSDYSSRYWTDLEWRPGRPGLQMTHPQALAGITRAAAGTAHPARPWSCQIAVGGPYYTKLSPGGHYRDGFDRLQKGGVRAEQVGAQVWAAVGHGASMLRAYSFDWELWRAEREFSPVGRSDLQTGVQVGSAVWEAMSLAFNQVAAREEALTQGFTAAPTLAPDGCLLCARGGLRWTVNTSETTRRGIKPGGVHFGDYPDED